ncbi:MAG: bacteriohopanetetrol glucosamine biosynthesis glycosyltransferase HpnI [Acidobacteria bacterium]|nr:bacteriohopanetetrol glucosamine biosynthesis glycosyltransferase HpnI [Acidobacteriota bacterium]
MPLLAYPLFALVTGSLVFSVLMVIAARKYATVPSPPPPAVWPPISLLTPLAGKDLGLQDNLRSSFLQDYPDFELVFGVGQESDPAVAVVRQLMQQYPRVPARLIIAGEPDCPNAKVHSLKAMTAAAAHDLLVMNDSDIRSAPNSLRTIAAEFAGPTLGLATCPSIAIAGPGLAARLEALLMNTQFMGGVLVARMLEGVKFALGPSAVVQRKALESIGGWDALDEYLAEDFMLGKLIAGQGTGVILSQVRVQHHIGNAGWAATLNHRLRWCRSTRRSRPYGYFGEVFTNPIPLALALVIALPASWPLLAATVIIRICSCWAVARWALRDPAALRDFWAIPFQDLIAFAVWTAGFYGNTVSWRGRTYELSSDGKFRLVRS